MSTNTVDASSLTVQPRRWHRWLVVAAGVIATLIILGWGVLRDPAGAYDDAYITYRYAENLRSGLGLRYNPDEWVLGTTTPIFALLLGGFGLLVNDIEWLGHGLGLLFWVATAWVAAGWLWQDKRPGAAVVAPLFIALQGALLRSVGMETPLLVLLMLIVGWAWLSGRKKLTVLLAALLLLTRHDSFLWLLFLGLEIWRRERRLPWREGLYTLLLTLPWFLFTFWRYGAPFPNSATAKFWQTNLMAVPDLPPFWSGLLAEATLSWAPFIVLVQVVALLPVLWHWLSRPERPYWWMGAWLVAYTLFFTLIGVVIFPWYFVPALAVYVLLLSVGLGLWFGDRGGGPQIFQRARWLSLGLAAVCLLVLFSGYGREVWAASQIEHGYQPAYIPAGKWLKENTELHSNVATIEIGMIGYQSQRPVLDTMGLVSLDMTDHQLGWRETLVYALSAHRPEYLVTLPNTAWDDVITAWWFQRDYALEEVFDNVSIYTRNPLPANVQAIPLEIPLANDILVTGILLTEQEIVPGLQVTADLHLFVEENQNTDYQLTAYLVDAQTFNRYAVNTEFPLSGWFNGKLWQAGDRLALPLRLTIPPDLPEGAYRLGTVLYDLENERGLPWRDDPAGPPADLQAGWLRNGAPPQMIAPVPIHEVREMVVWNNGLLLESAALPLETIASGEELPVQLAWQATRPIDQDLTLFIHLVDETGTIQAQTDSRPFEGRWPTTTWWEGERVQEVITLNIPEDFPPGNYRLSLGWYDDSGRVLLHNEEDHFFLTDEIFIASP